ncbi:hypothetical protein QBC34DRAFT_442586 [Podospora aff. communis PSN243]|uniref:Zn(2)-C6 fungal-type domain-containing protein n=1 Tax=Podospora aff. communis PSN243 TaxID=3040156 RepID=A0AAV9G6Y2_9PEZI|nr:hypothetical protein QBC34DRAFT_442586 [Podospora aff. communis PSN243]
MLKRKSHTKSRKGCTNCKTRRIKCDEKGPPCANCVARSWSTEPCTYEAPAPRLPPGTKRKNPPSSSSSSNSSVCQLQLPSPPSSHHLTISPRAFSSTPTPNSNPNAIDTRLLELELLHRWSTRTWTAFYAIPECQPYLLDHLPRQALRNSYLLNAIFASAAMDLAMASSRSSDRPSETRHYLRTALEYGNRALVEFRAQVDTLTPENIDLVAYFSSMSSIVSFVTPPGERGHAESCLDRLIGLIESLIATARFGVDKHEWLLASPCPARTIATEYAVDLGLMGLLDPGTRAAIELMTSVCKSVTLSDGRKAGEVFSYCLAVGQTKYCFAEERAGRLQQYYTSMFPIAGEEFVGGMRTREPMALLVIMYWGVLADRAAKSEWGGWIVGDTGREVVREASEMLVRSAIADVPGVAEGIAWTRYQVELAPLEGCLLPPGLVSGVVGEVGGVEEEVAGEESTKYPLRFASQPSGVFRGFAMRETHEEMRDGWIG